MKNTDMHLDRLPPQNLEAEQSVIGAILIDNDALPKALEILDSEDFYKLSHRKIFNAMTDLFDRNEPIDLITLTDYSQEERRNRGYRWRILSLIAYTYAPNSSKY